MDPRDLLDDLADFFVVPSFTRQGFRARSRLHAWEDAGRHSMAGRTVLVTGPTSGIGRAAVSSFARMHARVLLVGRDPERLELARTELVGWSGNSQIATYQADMGSLASVRAAADAIAASETRLDVIIDNAGAIIPERRQTPEGFELTFASVVLGPFVLVSRLLPLLRTSTDGRIVSVTSGGMYSQGLRLDDLDSASGRYSGQIVYARAKRAQVAMTREWARRLRPDHVVANAMHPGWADTPGLSSSLPRFHELLRPGLRSPEEAADTIVWLAASDEARGQTGRLFLDRRARPFDRLPGTRTKAEQRQALWECVASMTGERPELG